MAGVQSMGTTLTLSKSGDEAADTVIGHLSSIGEQATEAEEVDVTTLDSPNGAKEYIQGAKDPGSVEMSGNDMADGQTAKLKAIFSSGEVRDWVVTYPNGAKLSMKGYISNFKHGEATTDGLVTYGFTLRLSGIPVFDEPSSTE